MKKLMIGLAIAMLAGAASAAVLVSDDFSYSGALTANGWTPFSGSDGSITSDGSVATVGSGAEDIRFTTAFADQGVGDVFASFLLTVTSAAAGNTHTFGFLDAATFDSRFGMTSSGTDFTLNVYGTATAVLGSSAALSFGTPYLVTLGYDATTFTHSLWVNSDGTDFASPDLAFVAGVQTGIDNFYIRQAVPFGAGSASYTIDSLVVGENFSDVVTAIPEPATMGLLGLGALAMVLRRKMKK